MTTAPSKTRSTRKPALPIPADSATGDVSLPCQDRQAMITQTAFFIAESRGFAPGHELDDWLLAERLVEQQLQADQH